jgi:hypothetical protein
MGKRSNAKWRLLRKAYDEGPGWVTAYDYPTDLAQDWERNGCLEVQTRDEGPAVKITDTGRAALEAHDA